jgi:hypothetical protein
MGAEHSKMEDSVQDDLHDATMKEVALGHLHGPFSEQEIAEHFGSDKWLFNPRFAIENKVRAIDDGKRSALNLAYTTSFKLELYDVDTLAALVAAVADSLRVGRVSFDMDDDTVCSVPVHPEVASDAWSGRTLDLSRAYKQLALDRASRCLSVVGYYYQGRWVFFWCDGLPFGAIAAVYSFNRVSRSLHFLICKLLWGPCACFYDDYPTISPNASSAILSKAMSAMLTLLGWDHAKIGGLCGILQRSWGIGLVGQPQQRVFHLEQQRRAHRALVCDARIGQKQGRHFEIRGCPDSRSLELCEWFLCVKGAPVLGVFFF